MGNFNMASCAAYDCVATSIRQWHSNTGVVFPYIPIVAYLICALIWVLKSRLWSAVKRWLLVVMAFPLFSMAAFFIPLLLVSEDKYFDEVLLVSSVVLTLIVVGVLFWSLAKRR